MCVGTSCSQQFYTERGRGAWERSGPPSSGIEIIKRSCDSGVSITAHAGPENQAKSPYLLQTHTHTKERTDFCIFVRSWFISSSSELSSLTFLNYIQFLSRFGSVMTLWARDSEGRRAKRRWLRMREPDRSLPGQNNHSPFLGVKPWHRLFFLSQSCAFPNRLNSIFVLCVFCVVF